MDPLFRRLWFCLVILSLGECSLDRNPQPKCPQLTTPKNEHLLDCSSNRVEIDNTLHRVVLPELNKPSLADLRNNGLENIWGIEAPGTTSLDLSDNSLLIIRVSLDDLQNLSLANNQLFQLEEFAFKQCHSLEILDLSSNFFETIPKQAFGDSVQTLMMHHNKIKKIEENKVPDHLIYLDLSFNEIEEIQLGNLFNLRNLNLKNNRIQQLDLKSIYFLKNLETLDVSSNQIKEIDVKLFSSMNFLDSINLSNNQLQNHKELDVSPQVAIFNLSKNQLKNLHIIPRKNHFEILDLSHNNLTNIDIELENALDSLKILNSSHNNLDHINLTSRKGRSLMILDLSWNQLPNIPETLTPTNLPELSEISLDGNLINRLSFAEKGFAKLRKLSLSYLNELTEIQENTFSNLVHTFVKVRKGQKFNECENSLYLICSNNPKLNTIHQDALGDLQLCKLDLSHNSLSEIPENLTIWENVPWVNLQYNPLDCSCNMQWFLDRVLKIVYHHNQSLMNELKCLRPSWLKDKRLVHFFSWETKALCDIPSSRSILRPPEGNVKEKMPLEASTSVYIIITGCTGVLIILVAIGLFYHRLNVKKRRNQNRRL